MSTEKEYDRRNAEIYAAYRESNPQSRNAWCKANASRWGLSKVRLMQVLREEIEEHEIREEARAMYGLPPDAKKPKKVKEKQTLLLIAVIVIAAAALVWARIL